MMMIMTPDKTILNIMNIVLQYRGKKNLTALNAGMHLRDDIGFDSLDLAELTVRIEAEYGMDIFENGIVYTVGEIFKRLNIK